MTRCSLVLAVAAFLLAPAVPADAQDASAAADAPAQADVMIRTAVGEMLSNRSSPVPEIVAAVGGKALEGLQTFYAARDNAPLWASATALSPESDWVLDRSAQALPAAVEPLLAAAAGSRQADAQALARLDLLLSAIYAAAAVDPHDPSAPQDGGRALSVLAVTKDRLALLRDTLPVHPAFWRLREAITLYRGFAAVGGWPTVPNGPKLDLGDGGPRVDALRRRLIATGDMAPGEPQEGPFDAPLRQAVQGFQARHGLETDGVVGPKTLAALNASVDQRLATMAANLIRLQRQRRDWGERYIAVNIPAASYRLVVGGRVVFERPAVVGRPGWPTPQLDGVIDRVEFHPYWRIPVNIADQEVWPKQDADPGYFARTGIHVVDGQLVQNPGPGNPLGTVKFLFDNPYSVYLHDTTAPALFERAYRFSSHGCIRVSQAGDLARQLLASDPQWPAERVDAALNGGQNRTVALSDSIPLHVVYDTAWVAEDGTIQFRDDVYHRDILRASGQDANPAAAGRDAPASGCGA